MTVYSLTGCDDTGDHSSCVLLPANPTHNQNLHHALCGCVTLPGTQVTPPRGKVYTESPHIPSHCSLCSWCWWCQCLPVTTQIQPGVDVLPLLLCYTSQLYCSLSGSLLWWAQPPKLLLQLHYACNWRGDGSNDALFSQALSLWMNFMGFTDGKEPVIIYIIVCWCKSCNLS